MAVRKQADGWWLCELYPNGAKGKRIRKKFATKGEALAFEQHTITKPWQDEKDDNRTLIEVLKIWYYAHGLTLKDADRRLAVMTHASVCMGEPLAREFDAKLFSRYREKRLLGDFSRGNRVKKITPQTINLEQAYFRAVFNELIRLEEWKGENPIKNVRPFRTDESEMAFLTKEQIEQLLAECRNEGNGDLECIVKLCLSTGARWSEAQELNRSQVTEYKVTYTKTKGRKNRTIPISKDLYDSLPAVKSGRLFTDCYREFRSALQRTDIQLPAGQSSHVLRHTFASHFMMKGGNILVLQRVLGHTDIKMTMRYAHFAPEHLEEAVRLNPLA